MANIRKHTPPPGWKNPLAPQQPLTSVRWIAAALVGTLTAALLCVYVAICLLFWQGQWQLVFRPSRTITSTPATAGLRFEEVAFDTTETGVSQLHGWWVPAGSASAHTVLFLHGGSGSLSDTLQHVQALHSLGFDVFAFDYRGFGKSKNVHPSEQTTEEDADAAWRYLTETRHLNATAIVLDGAGVGAAIAAETARRHPQSPALVLEDPLPPMLASLQREPRMRLLPMHLVFHDRFDPTTTLAQLRIPKLFLYSSQHADAPYYAQAAEPKQMEIAGDGAGYLLILRRFLGNFVHGE